MTDTENNPILIQLHLFDFGHPNENIEDLLPAVWKATEALTSTDPVTRQRAIDSLLDVGAHKVSPLVAYMLATCLGDADLFIRRRVTFILADLISVDQSGQELPPNVRMVVRNYLQNMQDAIVYGLLEVSVADQHADQAIYNLFNACPYVGKYLGNILSDWKHPLAIRQRAIYFIGLVGFLDAMPVLEKLLTRLEARQTGQFTMTFAPTSIKSDNDLLPFLRTAINQLNVH